MTLVFETEKCGRLWLGGEKAVHNTLFLSENEVSYVWPACESAIPDTPQVFVFDAVDGTDAAQGDVTMDKIMPIITDVVELLVNGKSVLVACNNGADRSATLACMVLMRLLAWSSSQASAYLATMRNIVDLKSRAPPSRGRAQMVRPLDFLEKIQEALQGGGARENAKAALGFVPLRRKALELGFEARFPPGRTSQLTRADRKSSSDEGETTQSYDLVTDAENSDATLFGGDKGASRMGASASWLILDSPVSTPGGSSSGEGSELRRRKLRMLIEDLTDLNFKLENHVAASGGFEPGLTLKDASGKPAAVVVGTDLTLTAATESAPAGASAPEASLAGPQANEPSQEKEAAKEPDPKKPKVEGDAASQPGAKQDAPAEELAHGSEAAAAPAVADSKDAAAPDSRPATFQLVV